VAYAADAAARAGWSVQATTAQPQEANDDPPLPRSLHHSNENPAPSRLDVRNDQLSGHLERPRASTQPDRERARQLRDGRPTMLIVILPFWLWLATLSLLLTYRAAALLRRTLVALLRLSWRGAGTVASRKESV